MPLPPGVQRTPRDLSSPEFQRSVSDRELLEIVRHGRSGMPAIPALQSGGDAELLVAYVRTLSPGRELYGTYCAGCHGEDGLGMGTAGMGPDRPDVRFDRDYFAHHDADELRRKVWHMLDREGPAMPHFARRLSADDATAIVVFLRGRGSAAPAPKATPH
jgi:mono/diheme cytochrome c family protein